MVTSYQQVVDLRERGSYSLLFSVVDHSRVSLTQLEGVPCSDYVNASYINVSPASCVTASRFTDSVMCIFVVRENPL